ncbi:MAG: OmpA family protein [Bacteroidota bacterium]
MAASAQIAFDGPARSIDTLNSAFDENYLYIGYDGQRLIYTKLKHPANRGGSANPGSLWTATASENWEDARELPFSDTTSSSVPFGLVGENLIYGEVTPNFSTFDSKILAARVAGDTPDGEVSVPYFKNKSEFLSGYVSPDGNVLLLSMEGRNSYGVEDIYVSLRKSSGVWGFPKNLGAFVNTAFQEFTPFLSADKQTLYWSSNGREGEGSFDVYSSQRLDDTWQNWTEPVNLGSGVNTQGAETSFQLAGEYGYFVSTQNSDGYGDIRKIKLKEPEDLPTLDSIAPPQTDVDLLSREFHLYDAETGEKVQANLRFEGPELDTTFVDASSVILPRRQLFDMTLTVESVGYLKLERFFTSTELQANSLFRLEITPLAVGATVQLRNVLFQRGTIDFIGGSELELDRVVEMMESNPSIRILVKGHTDNVGDPTKNLQLSRRRAKKVKDYLLENGIASSRVQSRGYGGNDPIASNNSEDTRKLNRRVEFTIVEK